MSVAIIDYGLAIAPAATFRRAARSMENPKKSVTCDPEAAFRADRIVLPGVGVPSLIAAAASMRLTA